MAEAAYSKWVQCEFESHENYPYMAAEVLALAIHVVVGQYRLRSSMNRIGAFEASDLSLILSASTSLISSMVELLFCKQLTRVRFLYSAPVGSNLIAIAELHFVI